MDLGGLGYIQVGNAKIDLDAKECTDAFCWALPDLHLLKTQIVVEQIWKTNWQNLSWEIGRPP